MQQFFVSVTSGLDTMAQDTKFEAKQSGVTVALSSAVVSAVQEAANTGETLSNAASNTGSSRMQGLAGAAGALAAYNTYNKVKDILKDPNQVTGVSINISLGSSQSSGSSHDESTTAVGSQVISAGSVNVTARNPKPNPDGTPAPATANAGNILIEGSQVIATEDITLNADRNIDLLAAGNTSEHSSQNQSSSASVGVGFAFGGTQNGFTINASASRSKGQANGESQSSTNTHVQAGGTLTFNSGGDTTLQGATASGNKVTGTVGGDLILTSLQDTNTYSEKQSSAGVGVSLCIPPICAGASSVNVSVSKTNINSNYQSVGEQTAIRAGDGGFDIDVQGTTTLTGAQITSTDKAVQDGKNSFTSAGGIDMQDLQNSAQYDASSYSLSARVQGDSHEKDGTPMLDKAGQPIKGKPEGSAGYGSDSGQGSSTSTSGISGIAGDTSARTGDQETGLQPLFDAAKVKADVQGQVAITAEFGKSASKAWGDYATNKEKELRNLGKHEEADKWREGGTYRAAGHFVIGGLGGGSAGALASGGISLAADTLNSLQDELKDKLIALGMNPDAAVMFSQGAGMATAGTLGTAAGGTVGGASAFNTDTSNRQLHPTERQWARGNAAKYRDYLEKKTGERITIEVAEQRLLSAGYAITDDAARKTGRSDPDALSFISQYSPSNLFVASGSERADPLLGGNADGSWTPEQQARFGVPKVSQWADDQTAEAQRVLTSNSNCETDVKCGANRVAAVGKAYDALEQVKALYQDNPARVAQITGQQEQLLGQLSPKDMEHAKLASADADLMLDISGLGAVPGALRGTVSLFQRMGVGASRTANGANGGGNVANAVDDAAVTGRPTPRQSEIDVGKDLPPGARPQISFKNGQEVPYGTTGSVRPDYCLGNVCSVEVKNYNIATNSNGLISNVSQQAIDRAANLPPGMTQTIVIDIRGQTVTTQQLDSIRLQIVQRSNGAVSPNNIRFKDK